MESFGARIAELRRRNNLKQHDLGVLVGVSGSTISGYERDLAEPNIDCIIKLASVFRLSTDELLGISRVSSVPSNELSKVESMARISALELESLKSRVNILELNLDICDWKLEKRRLEYELHAKGSEIEFLRRKIKESGILIEPFFPPFNFELGLKKIEINYKWREEEEKDLKKLG